MKPLTSLIFAILIIAAVSCGEEQATEYTQENNTETSYFPLQVGNEWYYEVLDDTVEIYMKITGKTTKNNREYYTLTYTSYRGKGNKVSKENKMYLRSPDGLKIYEYKNNTETLYRDFSDVRTDSSYNKEFSTTDDPYIDIPMGRFNNVKSISNPNSMEPSFWYYAKGIGLIRYFWFRGEYRLKYAKVNG